MTLRIVHPRGDRTRERRPHRLLRQDGALSDAVATILLVGVTVTLVAGASLGLVSKTDPLAAAEGLDLAASAVEGSSDVTLLHARGDTYPGSALRALVTVDGVTRHDGPIPAVSFGLGDAVALPVGAPLAAGSRVSVAIVDVARGQTVATAELGVSEAIIAQVPPSRTFVLTLTVAGGAGRVVLAPPAELLLEAEVYHAAGRKNVRHVYVDLTSMKGPAWATLRDDGAGGDRVAGDGVWGARVLVPRDVEGGLKTLHAAAVDFDGGRATASLEIEMIRRLEVTEQFLNPTGSPLPDARTCPEGIAAVQSYRYGISGAAAGDLAGAVREGDRVTAFVTIAPGCTDVAVSLVSYQAPSAVFSWETAGEQTFFASATAVLGPGEHVLEIDVPACYFQVSLVLGTPILVQGPTFTNNYYSKQGRLLDADNGGERPCVAGA